MIKFFYYTSILIIIFCLSIKYNNYHLKVHSVITDTNNLANNDTNITHVLLWTQIRSGSRFTGELLSLNPTVFYTEEPVAELKYAQDQAYLNSINISTFLFDINNCNFDLYPGYNNVKTLFLHTHNKEIFYLHRDRLLRKDVKKIDKAICNSSKIRLFRIVAAPLEHVEPLLRKQDYNLKVIFLIRDPRAILNSRSDLLMHNVSIKVFSKHPCDKLYEDTNTYIRMKKLYPKKLMHVYYEDLVQSPRTTLKSLYKFIGVPYTIRTEGMLMANTKVETLSKHPYVLQRKSLKHLNQWRMKMNYNDVTKIQTKCESVLNILGFRIFETRAEFKNFGLNSLQETQNLDDLI